MRRGGPVVFLLGLLAFAPTVRAYTPRQGAFWAPNRDFMKRVQTVVLEPCEVPDRFRLDDTLFASSDPVRWLIDSLVVVELERAGLTVISGRESAHVFSTLVDSAGDLFDPYTGEVDKVRRQARVLRTRDILRARFTPDAWITLDIGLENVQAEKGWAHWSGASEYSSLQNVIVSSLREPKVNEVLGLTLSIVLEARELGGRYQHSGGIHLTEHTRDGLNVPIPSTQYFRDREDVVAAVRRVLWPLTRAAARRPRTRGGAP